MMKFKETFQFEFNYQLRRLWTWLLLTALIVVSFLLTRDGSLAEALHDDFFVNSPFSIAKVTVVGSLLWLLAAAVITGEAAARDVASRMHPLLYTTGVTRLSYLGGRFLAALSVNLLLLLAVQFGFILAIYLPGMDAALVGPFRIEAHLTNYLYIAVPNAITATAVQFLLASASGRPMAAYLGSLILFFMSYIVGLFLLLQGRQDLANLLDPIGVHFILSEISHLWTSAEKSVRLVSLEGTVLVNRIIWLSVGAAAAFIAYVRFKFDHKVAMPLIPSWLRTKKHKLTAPGVSGSSEKLVSPSFKLSDSQLRSTLSYAWSSFKSVAGSWAGLGLLVLIPLMVIPVVIDQMESNGVPFIPNTIRVINELVAPLSAEVSRWVIIPLLIVYFAGELRWRERDAHINELVDTMPISEWVLLMGKFLGLSLLLIAFMGLQMLAAVLAQSILDYHQYEIGLYIRILFGLQLPEYLLFALLALVVHSLINQKYVGHLAAVMMYVLITLAPLFGIEHKLFIYASSPNWSYTDMRGFGSSIWPWLSFKIYWTGWAIVILCIGKLLWIRGRESGFQNRWLVVRQRLTSTTMFVIGLGLFIIVVLGGYIFYNTIELNTYRTSTEVKELKAGYERKYGHFRNTPQPEVVDADISVNIKPDEGSAEIKGTYRLVNNTNVPIDTILILSQPGVDTDSVIFDRSYVVSSSDDGLWLQPYQFDNPLLPGESISMIFRVKLARNGFSNSGADERVSSNGTYFLGNEVMPSVGYDESRELTNAADRREYKLQPRREIASLYDPTASKQKTSNGIMLNTKIETDANQTAVAPGKLISSKVEGNRKSFHYATSAPIGAEWAFLSANYEVKQEKWNDIDIQVFHAPQHGNNIEKMIKSVKESMTYYSTHYGPYRYSHLTLVEHPGNGSGMHADASMISFGEGFSLWAPKANEGLDLPYAIVAHETAHQWTVPYARVEGAPVMSESIAWYEAMQAIDSSRGHEQLNLLRRFMRQPYPYAPIRRGEPLLRGLDPYMSYRKGPFALYSLSQYGSIDSVNHALKRMLETHRKPGALLATTLDLYKELQRSTPDSLQYLLHDFFEVNTYWEMSIKEASAVTEGNETSVTISLTANKVVIDSAGSRKEIPMNDLIEIGVYDSSNKELYRKMHRVNTGEQELVVKMKGEADWVAIDPRYLLIDLEADDNRLKVKSGNSKS